MSGRDRVADVLPYAKRAGDYYRAACPFCEDEGHRDKKTSLVIRADSGRYWCYRCGEKGRLREAPDPTMVEQDRAPGEIKVFEPPDGFMRLGVEPALSSMTHEPAREYLKSRGVRKATILRASIGVCDVPPWGGRVLVPILSEDGEEWWGWSSRLWTKKVSPNAQGVAGLKYLYPPEMTRGAIMYNSRVLTQKTEEPALIVEGVFDVLPFYDDACATLGHPSPEQVKKMLAARRPVVAVPDGDAWVEGQMLAARLRFDGQRAGYVKLPPRVDPDEVDPEWLMEEARRSLERPVL